MKNKLFISLLLLLVSATLVYAQPGPYGTDVRACFKDEQGNFITLANNNYDIKWITKKSVLENSRTWEIIPDTLSYKTDTTGSYGRNRGTGEQILIYADTVYIVNVWKTPAGGGIRVGSHFLIVKNNADTMRLYPPMGHFGHYLFLDDICFRQGNYIIPSLVYTFHSSLKKEYRRHFRPNLYDDWELFRLESEIPIYKTIYAECIELFKNQKIASKHLRSLTRQGSSSDWFYKEYFDNNVHYNLRGGILLGNRYRVKEGEQDENYHQLFGIIASGIFLYQKGENSPIEYGYIEVPINITGIEEKDSKETIRFHNLRDTEILEVSSLEGRNSQKHYDALGCYNGILQYKENRGYQKTMWGFYRLYINPPTTEELKRIAAKHAEDNKLYLEEDKAKLLYDND